MCSSTLPLGHNTHIYKGTWFQYLPWQPSGKHRSCSHISAPKWRFASSFFATAMVCNLRLGISKDEILKLQVVKAKQETIDTLRAVYSSVLYDELQLFILIIRQKKLHFFELRMSPH